MCVFAPTLACSTTTTTAGFPYLLQFTSAKAAAGTAKGGIPPLEELAFDELVQSPVCDGLIQRWEAATGLVHDCAAKG